MNPKSQELPNLAFPASQVAFDPTSQSLVLANPSHVISYALPTQTISSQSTWSLPNLQSIDQSSGPQNISPPLNTTSLRFLPSHAKSKIHISPSGLVVTNQSNAEEIAIANIGFKTGIHYWEIICPKQCKNINVGIIQEGWTLTNTSADNALIQANAFKTSTPRVIGLRLDLIRGELRFWLNGNFQAQKTIKNLAINTWYPCVKLKEIGTQIILNPFATDPDSIYPIYEPQSKLAISQIKCTLSLFAVIATTGLDRLDKDTTKFEEFLQFESGDDTFAPVDKTIDETGFIVAFRFKNPEDAEKFSKANQDKKIQK